MRECNSELRGSESSDMKFVMPIETLLPIGSIYYRKKVVDDTLVIDMSVKYRIVDYTNIKIKGVWRRGVLYENIYASEKNYVKVREFSKFIRKFIPVDLYEDNKLGWGKINEYC